MVTGKKLVGKDGLLNDFGQDFTKYLYNEIL